MSTSEPKIPKSPREDDKKDKKDKKRGGDDKTSKGGSSAEIKVTPGADTPSLEKKQESRLDLKVVYGTGKSFENCGKCLLHFKLPRNIANVCDNYFVSR